MAKHRTHSVAFKRQVSQEYLAGETPHGLSRRPDISRNLIRVWVDKYQAGALDEDVAAADLLQVYEARIAALERLVAPPCRLCHRPLHRRPADACNVAQGDRKPQAAVRLPSSLRQRIAICGRSLSQAALR